MICNFAVFVKSHAFSSFSFLLGEKCLYFQKNYDMISLYMKKAIFSIFSTLFAC